MRFSLARRLVVTVLLGAAAAAQSAPPAVAPVLPDSPAPRLPPIAASQANPHAQPSPVEPASPAELYGALYRDVQLAHLYADSKTFADMIPRATPRELVAQYRAARAQPGFDLRQFVESHFSAPPQDRSNYVSDPNQNVTAHIDTLWDVLRRAPDPLVSRWSSLLALPAPYVVPGGRFDEVYYWDSYFIMLGLEQSGRHELVRDELHDFATLIDRYGHIPNGNRTYYLSRSQPPFFAQMVGLVAGRDGDDVYLQYLPELKAEYAYWMNGADKLAAGKAYRHVVRLADGTLLNRYWDDLATPRDESYREDVATAGRIPARDPGDLWRNLRAGGETGWDFSSRWFADNATLASIEVTSLIPVDLNALLYGLERTLAKAYRLEGDAAHAENMEMRARTRAEAVARVLWDPRIEAFGDYNFVARQLTHRLTAATVYPLFAGMATREQAVKIAATIRARLLRPGGLATTETRTGQQWDKPNGWAPLQYLAVEGLRRYGQGELAREIATRWIRTSVAAYVRTGKLVEKYDISGAASAAAVAGGGEYPLQDGFGWTNGVLRTLLAAYPEAVDASTAKPSPRALTPASPPQPEAAAGRDAQ
ncbi:alpha,alpha-trehalase TreF [Trinickia caryophylli]|uniref:Putative periplasmic trehalase n=1 Tax=Trinickia caryophylli TaxID=28094 RepID=A0A1X7EBM5_TRICW|nr:alpha,alpha-trehalase TreF [Trinickia caryophylli]PMS12934.1 alpha,alpha-trehalase TreF [Trinickia caryophylli]TRX14695.1 alpha,alpha-trehalase TreF [Trinickia caryophylli]WQE14538.1 alpha,alpha-trehalase TreF [Trinickia caryophylli]SMF31216.1 alpha,alpha-trehalase [Trinickia caryophylli]GLU32055.1 periplasmic trehalase [Trinickia caryophylli]